MPAKGIELESRTDLIRTTSMLIKLLEQHSKGTGVGGQITIDNPVLKELMAIVINTFDSTFGFAYQTMISQISNINVNNLLVKFTEVGSNTVKTKYNYSNKSDTVSTTTSTTDIKLSIEIPKDGKISKMLMRYNLPGMSVKLGGGLLNKTNANITLRGKKLVQLV